MCLTASKEMLNLHAASPCIKLCTLSSMPAWAFHLFLVFAIPPSAIIGFEVVLQQSINRSPSAWRAHRESYWTTVAIHCPIVSQPYASGGEETVERICCQFHFPPTIATRYRFIEPTLGILHMSPTHPS